MCVSLPNQRGFPSVSKHACRWIDCSKIGTIELMNRINWLLTINDFYCYIYILYFQFEINNLNIGTLLLLSN